MPKFRALLFFAAAFVGAFLTVGFSISVATPHLVNQDSVAHFLLNDGWKENAALSFVHEFFNLSTEDVYQQASAQQMIFHGKYKQIRSQLDYSFHKSYSRKRVFFQDQVIDSMLDENEFVLFQSAQNCTRVSRPWLIFTAGAMGAGKSHTIKILHQKGRFPLQSFTTVDPDRIRHRLPEFESYVEHNPEHAGELTRKESGLIAEVLTEAALERGHNVLVDGSLRDADWYQNYIQSLRHNHPQLRLAILHVTAPRESVFENALVSVWVVVHSVKLLHLHAILFVLSNLTHCPTTPT